MEDILSLTATSQVRATLGISDRDLGEAEFDAPRVELELKMSLDEDSIDYATIISEAEAGTPTAEQTKRHNYLKLYAMYWCAVVVIPRLRLAATQKMSDGDNSMERFLKPEFDKLESMYGAKAGAYKISLEDAISGSTTTSPTYSQFGGAVPTYDPVTNT